MNDTILGKISYVHFGTLDGRIGLFLTLSGTWSVGTESTWDPATITPDKHHKWTEEDRDKQLAIIMNKVSKLLSEAKVEEVHELLNVPVEFTTKNGRLIDWRILTEVL